MVGSGKRADDCLHRVRGWCGVRVVKAGDCWLIWLHWSSTTIIVVAANVILVRGGKRSRTAHSNTRIRAVERQRSAKIDAGNGAGDLGLCHRARSRNRLCQGGQHVDLAVTGTNAESRGRYGLRPANRGSADGYRWWERVAAAGIGNRKARYGSRIRHD